MRCRIISFLVSLILSISNINANDTIPLINDSTPISLPKENINWGRLGFHTGMFIGCGGVMMIVLEALPENATAWNKTELRETPVFQRWKDHVKKGPVIDKDRPAFNYILHPYAGAVYYQAARGSGCNWWQSFLYCTFVSNVLWEYGFEAFNEIPSIQDLLITPIIGSAFGEGFHLYKKKILKNDYRVLGSRFLGKTICWFIDPFNEFGNVIFQEKDRVTSTFLVSNNQKLITLRIKI
jgi:hypothetical protein